MVVNVGFIPSSVNYSSNKESIPALPDDFEEADRQFVIEMVDKCMEERYPAFEPEIVYGIHKEYFLPALKVLQFVDGKYYSPGYEVEWVDMCLRAECKKHPDSYTRTTLRMVTDDDGNHTLIAEPPDLVMQNLHDAPHEKCDCGIYGSVNLEEIQEYLMAFRPSPWQSGVYLGTFASASANLPPEPRNVLCIIEPSPDAKVILCRKGWKASSAFVSEIVGETFHMDQASNLLSIAWKREIDIRRLYENR